MFLPLLAVLGLACHNENKIVDKGSGESYSTDGSTPTQNETAVTKASEACQLPDDLELPTDDTGENVSVFWEAFGESAFDDGSVLADFLYRYDDSIYTRSYAAYYRTNKLSGAYISGSYDPDELVFASDGAFINADPFSQLKSSSGCEASDSITSILRLFQTDADASEGLASISYEDSDSTEGIKTLTYWVTDRYSGENEGQYALVFLYNGVNVYGAFFVYTADGRTYDVLDSYNLNINAPQVETTATSLEKTAAENTSDGSYSFYTNE